MEFTVRRHVDDGGLSVPNFPVVDSVLLHQPFISHADRGIPHFRNKTLAGNVPRIPRQPRLQNLSVRCLNGFGDGMGGKTFHDSGVPKHRFFRNTLRRNHPSHVKHAFRQGAGFVRNHRVQMRHLLQIVGTLYQHADVRRRSDAAKERQGHGNDQSARAGDYQEGAGAHHPIHPVARKNRRNESQQHRTGHHDWRVVPSEPGDEILRLRLLGGGIFHQLQNLSHGGILILLLRPNLQQAFSVNASGNNLISRNRRARHRLSGECRCVHHALPFQHRAVHRNLLPGANHQNISNLHFLRIHFLDGAIGSLNIGKIRGDVHQLRNGFSGFPHRVALKPFTHLVEQHHRNRLAVFTGHKSAHRRQGHEKALVQQLPVLYAEKTFFYHIPAGNQIRN